jgi:glycosyltransferase involved in cell wall biosynthesis
MKILLISRATLFSNAGGDTTQIVNTANYLKKLGVEADIKLTNEEIDYSNYDAIHFFNIVRPADILYHIGKSGKRYFVSTIFVDYLEYEKKAFKGARKFLFYFLSADAIEYLKVLARSVFNREKVISPFYILHGHRNSIQKVISGASLLLPNSNSEYSRLVQRYKTEQSYRVIPNGIDSSLFNFAGNGEEKKDDNLVICVARIEPLKNQLNVIRALNNTKFKLLIIGAASTNQKRYYEMCKKEATSNVIFINHLPQHELLQYYRKAKVHVLASWFETTGLSSLESAAMGCNIVITDKGDTKEYFGNYAYYCDPESIDSIFTAVTRASETAVDKGLQEMIAENFTWEIAAKKTQLAYREILSNI